MRPAFRIVESRCAMTKVVRPFASFSIDSCTIFSLSLSSAEVASSKIRIAGFFQKYPCDRQTLLLAARQLDTSLTDIGLIATRQL